MTNIVANGNAYSDDGSSSRDMQGGGFRQWLLPMLRDVMQQTGDGSSAATDAADAAALSASTASSAAIAAQDALDAIALIGNGWTPVPRIAVDGARYVLEIYDWTGGLGPKPATGFLAASGLVPNVAGGLNFRGAVAYADLTGKPTLGTAAALNVPPEPATAATAAQVVRGDDPRLTASAGGLPRSARTSNTALANGDLGTLIDITSGTFTQTFVAAATLGNGWWCYLRNSGDGDITLDPNGAETIDGRTSYVMYPGEMRLVQCDGAALRTVVLNSFYRVWATSADFVKPPGYKRFLGDLWGSGGSGRKAATGAAAGGGGGAWALIDLPASTLPDTSAIVIAAATPGPATDATHGVAGSASSFAGLQALGGAGGTTATAAGAVSPFADGGGGTTSNPAVAPRAATRGAGAGAGFGTSGATIFPGGPSVYGGKGGGNGTTTSGQDGEVPGGGGGATKTGPKAGDGARGELRLWGVF